LIASVYAGASQQRIKLMKVAPALATIAFSLALVACQNEPEEAPDITEVIPADEGTDAAAEGAEAETGDDAGIEPSAPATMESGSNEDGGRVIDPERNKLLPAD
jgi:hypothetical protein